MKDKKLLFARILCRTGSLKALHALTGSSLAVLNYHRISTGGSTRATIFEEGVFGPSAAQFERQIQWLSKNTEVLGEAEVIERLLTGTKFADPSCVVTFDDAYIDTYNTAYPILRKYRIPAIFFVPTALISSRRVGWWDVVAYLVKRTVKPSIQLGDEVVPMANRAEAVHRIVAKLKNGATRTATPSLDSIAIACDVPLPPPELQDRELMTWDQLREVSRGGIAIGSHTHSHPVLSMLDRDSQREEFRLSKEILEREIGSRVRSLAYPFGGSFHFDPDSKLLAAECGYDIAFTFQGRINTGRIDRYGVKRIKMPDDPEVMAASFLLPRIFQ